MFDPSRRPGPRGAGLHLEALEDRAVPAVIGGVVYDDLSRNGLLGAGEPGIAGSQLRLLDAAGQVVATTTTDAQGRYQFTRRDAAAAAPAVLAHEADFGSARTDVSRTAEVVQFDAALGTLTAVEIRVEGGVESRVQLENLEKDQATLKTDLSATIRFQAPGAGTVEAKPTTQLEGVLGGFDGQLDLGGASAKDFGPTRLDGQFTTLTLTNPADLAAYVGTGKVALTQSASVSSATTGPGNLLALIQSTASGKVKVVYHYTPGNDLGPGRYTIVQTQPAGFLDWFETRDNATPLPYSRHSDAIPVTITSPTERQVTNHFGERRADPVPVTTTGTPAPQTGDDLLGGKILFSSRMRLLLLGM